MAHKENILYVTSTKHQQPFSKDVLGFAPGNVYLSVEDQNARIWYGGRTPTADEGHPLLAGASYSFNAPDLENFKVIAETGTAKIFFTAKGL